MSHDLLERYEPVIGLEVHTHLATESKLFSPAPVRYGDEPNHNTSPIDLGMPGVLPVLNEAVIDLAIRLGLATHCSVHRRSIFARKNYFYPDLPKGYQISQYEDPVVTGGWIDIELPGSGTGAGAVGTTKRIHITRAHLEEDAGKLIHDDAIAGSGSQLDFNRCGVPLLEIVSEPDLRSAAEAGAYLRTLRGILRYTGVSHADMEKGQFRCDANVSLRPRGSEELGTRTELKNMNSFRYVEAAIDAEIERQAEILDTGGAVIQSTIRYDPDTGRIQVLREKENADDYRYFPDPDLIPLQISEDQIERVRASLPELPDEKRARFVSQYTLSDHDARLLTETRALADFFEAAAQAHGEPRGVANWLLRDVRELLRERDVDVDALALTPEMLAALIALVEDGRLTARGGREILVVLADEGGDPEVLMRELSLEALSDTGALEEAVAAVLAANAAAVAKFKGGDAKTLNFLMGQVMKQTGGKANPAEVKRILAARLE